MANLFPEILGIEAGQNSDLAKRVVDRVKAGNPNIVIKPYKAGAPSILNIPTAVPKKSKDKVRWQHAKRALIIRDKCKDKEHGYLRFLHVFVSVGDVVEEYQFTLSIENECPYSCSFCYLQGPLGNTPIPTIFTNLQDSGVLLRELKIALLAMHMHTQTHGVLHNIGWDQKDWVHDLIKVLNTIIPEKVEDIPIQQLFNVNKDNIKKAISHSSMETLKPITDNFDNFGFSHLTDTFIFNCGEVNDALAYDHLTDNSKFLIGLFSTDTMKNDGAVLLFRTQSTNFDNLKKLTPGENVKVSATVLPFSTFAQGPPDRVDRLKGVDELLTLGYQISLNIDPIILVTDTMNTYKKVIDDIKIHFSYESPKFQGITIGMLRFGDRALYANIRKRHTDVYGHAKRNMPRIKGDEKYRYDRVMRVDIYKELIAYIQSEMPGVEVELSTEPVDVWTDVGLTP